MGNSTIDMNTFKQLMDDLGKEFIVELVETYIAETPQLIENLQKALVEQDSDTFRRAAHSIKSSSASLGAMQLSEQARHLEMAGKSAELQGIEAQLAEFISQYTLAQKELLELIHGS